jgi:hypothetical protein
MSNIAETVDKDGLKYHADMIEIYLEDIRSGQNRKADIDYHLRQIGDLFMHAELTVLEKRTIELPALFDVAA